MKNLNLLLLLAVTLLTGITISVSAQSIPERVNKGVFIDKKGQIHNQGGIIVGFIDKDDIVKNSKGKKVYFIDKNGNVVDANGRNLGKARKNGDYASIDGVSVLTVRDTKEEQCEILDPQGHSLGTVHKNYKLHACAAHCFFLAQKKEKAKE